MAPEHHTKFYIQKVMNTFDFQTGGTEWPIVAAIVVFIKTVDNI